MKTLLNYDTASVSDALDSLGVEGALLGLKLVSSNFNQKMVGPAFTVKYEPYQVAPEEFKNAGNYIDEVPANSIIVIDNGGKNHCTSWGGILTQVAINKNIAGTVVNGAVRDIAKIEKSGYPVFSKATYMRSGKNRVYKSAQQVPIKIGEVCIKPGDVIFADVDGVVVIPQKLLNQILTLVKNISYNETKILTYINNRMSLQDARKKCNYHTPWEKDETSN